MVDGEGHGEWSPPLTYSHTLESEDTEVLMEYTVETTACTCEMS